MGDNRIPLTEIRPSPTSDGLKLLTYESILAHGATVQRTPRVLPAPAPVIRRLAMGFPIRPANDGLSDGAAIDGGLNPVPVTFGIAIFPTVALGILTAIRQPPSVVPLLGAHRNNTSPPMDGHERIPVQSGE